MRILVTGASGFAGSLLIPRLLADGHDVRALTRDPARVRHEVTEVKVLRGDALTGDGLSKALAGVEVAYYLIHSMEAPPEGSSSLLRTFPERELHSARTFATAASRAGVNRIVYLGGLQPGGGPISSTSRHLASREAVERILREAVPDSVALRASIVIGARSRSFRLLVRLIERLPVLPLPAWQGFRTRPIDARDITEMLAAAALAPALAGHSLDVGGPDVLTYGDMIGRIAELMLVARPKLRLGVSMTPILARFAAAIAGEDPELVVPLMEGLTGDLLGAEHHAADALNVNLHSFDSAVEHALREWEATEPLAAR